jgi:hypothetical protein
MPSKTLNADAVVSLGTGHESGRSVIVFQIRDDGSMSTSAVVKARIPGLADAELIAVPYTNRGTGAAVAASTAITAEGLFEVDATGVEIVLDNNWTSGAGSVHYVPLIG